MELNRNQWFMAGLLLLLLGVQFRMVESFVLTPELTEFLADQTAHPVAAAGDALGGLVRPEAVAPKKVRPPEWVGWSLLSVGAVFVLHSLSMKRPD